MDGNHPTNPRANRHRDPVTLTQPNPSADRHAHSRADRDTHRDIAATHTLTRALGNAVTIRPATNSAGPTPQRCQRAAQPLL